MTVGTHIGINVSCNILSPYKILKLKCIIKYYNKIKCKILKTI